MTDAPLIDWIDRYPNAPGWKGTETSREAAASVTTHEAYSGILAVLRCHGPKTADEVAEIMGLSVLYVRPRCSEMKLKGWIEPTGVRRPNASGRNADVLGITP